MRVIRHCQDWNEVWNQVDGTEGVGHHKHPQCLGEPRCWRVFSGEPERQAISCDLFAQILKLSMMLMDSGMPRPLFVTRATQSRAVIRDPVC